MVSRLSPGAVLAVVGLPLALPMLIAEDRHYSGMSRAWEGPEARQVMQSSITVAGPDPVLRRERVVLPDRQVEFLSISGGHLSYEMLFTGSYTAGWSGTAVLRGLRHRYLPPSEGEAMVEAAGTAATPLGPVDYIMARNALRRCFLFAQVAAGAPGRAADRELRGFKCAAPDAVPQGRLQAEMLDLMGRLRLWDEA